MSKKLKILLVGCGNMGSAMLRGWLAQADKPEVTIVDRKYENSDLQIYRSINNLSQSSIFDFVVLAVKPSTGMDAIKTVYKQIGSNLEQATIVSVMAGGTVSDIEETVGYKNPQVIRVMPNTPCCVSAGAIGMYANMNVPVANVKKCESLFESIGQVVQVAKEEDLRSVAAIAGSSPAYVFLLTELLEKVGVEMGLDFKDAAELSRATIYGAGKMLHELPDSTEQLRKNVTSPGGTTAAALSVLMSEENWPKAVKEAAFACSERMKELGG